jgi:hypothetical protein
MSTVHIDYIAAQLSRVERWISLGPQLAKTFQERAIVALELEELGEPALPGESMDAIERGLMRSYGRKCDEELRRLCRSR